MKIWFLLLLATISCTPKIVTYINTNSNFKSFESYRLVSSQLESTNVAPENSFIFDLIKDHIHSQMERRNYKTSNISPDLLLRYEITSNTRVQTNTTQDPFLLTPTQVNSRLIYESVLLLELYDQNKKLVWQGSYDLKQQRKEKKTSRAIQKAIGYIFTSYPYQALSGDVVEALKSIEKD